MKPACPHGYANRGKCGRCRAARRGHTALPLVDTHTAEADMSQTRTTDLEHPNTSEPDATPVAARQTVERVTQGGGGQDDQQQ